MDAFICKVGDYPAIQRASLVFTIVWKFHESSWKSAFQEKAKAKVSRTSESANYDVQNRKPAKFSEPDSDLAHLPKCNRQKVQIWLKISFQSLLLPAHPHVRWSGGQVGRARKLQMRPSRELVAVMHTLLPDAFKCIQMFSLVL